MNARNEKNANERQEERIGTDPGESGGSAGPDSDDRASSSRSGRSWSPWAGLSEIQEAVSELLDSTLRGLGPATGRFPRYDLVRIAGQGYRALFDLPGVRKEALEVTTVGDELTVSGERQRPELPEGSELLRAERGHGRFRRTLRLPPDVDPRGLKARLEDGVLTVELPRRADSEVQTVEVEG